MIRHAWILLATGVLSALLAAHGAAQCRTVRELADAHSFQERSARIRSLYSLGEKAIPTLIEETASSGKFSVLLNAPKSSTIEGPLWRYCGVIAAYMVETLLSRTELALTEPPHPDDGLFFGFDDKDYVYRQGVIKKSDGRLVGPSDLRKIHDLYSDWWKARKAKTLEEMREDWRNGSRPLTGSEFHWE